MKKFGLLAIAVSGILSLGSCKDEETISSKERPTKGSIAIAVDQAFQPIMEQQLKVFDSTYPDADITAIYTSETEAYRLLFEDSIRLIITSTDITQEQKDWGKARKIAFHSMKMARDGVAVIVHPSSDDDKMTIGILKNILNGDFVRKYKVIFDQSGSSTFNYITKNVMDGEAIDTANVFSAGSNEEVIRYVSNNPGTLGFVGVNHIFKGSQNESEIAFVDGVKVVALENKNDSIQGFFQPYMYYLFNKHYPLTRDIYFVSKETWKGVGSGLIGFLTQPPGQTLFYKAWMVPLRSNVEIKEAVMR